jgi:5-methylcytosine-specific restriction endonuclease McrA
MPPKLKTLRPQISMIKPLIGRMPGEKARDQIREKNDPWRRWYHSAEWKKLRMSVLIRDRFTCQLCGRVDGNTSRLVGDHKRSHHGERALFFDKSNVWCVCKPCHDSEKQRMDKADRLR